MKIKLKNLVGILSALVLAGAMTTAVFAVEQTPVTISAPVISAPIVSAPSADLTRAQAVEKLWQLSGKPVVNYLMQFEDVTEDSEAAEAIRWAVSEKIARGYGDGTFRPECSITREQLATVTYHYIQKFNMGFKGCWMFLMPYEDREMVREWAFEPVMWMVSSRLFDPELGKLEPQKAVTVAEGENFFAALTKLAKEKEIVFDQFDLSN